MLIKLLLLVSALFIWENAFCQSELKLGEKAPTIHITDFIANIPTDKSLNDKFILLEFWATWCAPCLGAVPDLNKLREKYKNRNDILFLSMTYENQAKVQKTLNRIEFKTIVVSDQTNQTQTDFQVDYLPRTFLIDNKGILKWIGGPFELSDSIFERFLNGGDLNKKDKNNNTDVAVTAVETTKNENDKENDLSSYASSILRSDNTHFNFTLREEANKSGSGRAVNPSKGVYEIYNYEGKSIISDLLGVTRQQIEIPNSFENKRFSAYYKNKNVNNLDFYPNIKAEFLKALNLTENVEEKSMDVYELVVLDKTKLQISESNDGMQHAGENYTHILFSNNTIDALATEIGIKFNLIIQNKTELMDYYDFLLRKDSMESLLEDLSSYGLYLKKTKKTMKYYNYK